MTACSNQEMSGNNLLLIPVVASQQIDPMDANAELSIFLKDKNASEYSVFNILSEVFPEPNAKVSMISIRKIRKEDTDAYYGVIIFDGIPDDDSVSGYRYDIQLEQSFAAEWEITEIKLSWRCWPDRGHQDFNITPCL